MRLDATEKAGSRTQDGTREDGFMCPVGLVEGVEAAIQQGESRDGWMGIQWRDDKLLGSLFWVWVISRMSLFDAILLLVGCMTIA